MHLVGYKPAGDTINPAFVPGVTGCHSLCSWQGNHRDRTDLLLPRHRERLMRDIESPDAFCKSQGPPQELFSTCHSKPAHLFYHPRTHLCLSEIYYLLNIYYLHCNSRIKSSFAFISQLLP